MRTRFVFLTLLMSVLMLTGCSSSRDFDDIRAEMQRLDERPTGTVPDVPEYESQELFFYSASDMRSPFRSPVQEQEALPTIVDSGVAPDSDREPEALESFSLSTLTMVGHIESAGGGLRALVVDPTGELHQVRPGQYMGQNHGRVVSVTAQRVELQEIVPSGRGGWLERPQTLSVSE